MSRFDKHLRRVTGIVYGIFLILSITYIVLGSKMLPVDWLGEEYVCSEYTGSWYQIDGNGAQTEIEVPGKLDVPANETMTVATILPGDIPEPTYLVFQSGKQDMEFYVNGELRGEYTTKKTRVFGRISAVAFYYLKIYPEDAGQELRVTAVTEAKPYSGTMNRVYQGTQMEVLRFLLIHRGGMQMFIAFGILAMSAFVIVASLLLRIFFHGSMDLFYLATGVWLAVCWEVANSELRQFLFPNMSVANDTTFLMILLMPTAFLTYLNSVQKGRYRVCSRILTCISLVTYALCVTLHCLKIRDYTNLMVIIGSVSIVVIAFLLTTILIDIFKKRAKDYFFVAIGTLILFSAGLLELVYYLWKARGTKGLILEIGMLLMLGFATVNAVQQVFRINMEKNEAVVAKEMRGRFLANMSHEIRTPINTVLGFDTMILRECKDEKIVQYAADIKNAGQSLLALVNDVLDFSKIESGKMELMENEYDFSSLLHDVIAMISMKAANKGLKLNTSIDEHLPFMLFGDEMRIKQILINLLNNAVKYTERGSVSLEISGERQEEEVLLHFCVKDTGIGIRPEDLPKLFMEYERIEEQRNKNIEGTGLGMSITTKLLKLMDSKLEVDSVYGEGSDFHFDLRQRIVREDEIGKLEDRINRRVDLYQYRVSFTAPDAKVLVVDDNAMNRSVFRALLSHTDIQITEAAGGWECIERGREVKYDLIFLDHMMPELDGIETLRKMREIPDFKNADTPVIALTANAISGAREMYLAEGFRDFLTKPIDPDKLEKTIGKYLPEELITKTTEEMPEAIEAREQIVGIRHEETERTELPEIEGVYWEIALSMLRNRSLLKATVEEFIAFADDQKETLSERFGKLAGAGAAEEAEAFRQYRIQIHSMKTNAAMIGAVGLAEIGKMLEQAARDENRNWINQMTDYFLQKWEELADRLRTHFGRTRENRSVEPVDYEMVRAYLGQLETAADEMDMDAMDTIAEALTAYAYPAEEQQIVDAIAEAVRGVAYDTCLSLVQELGELIGAGEDQ